MALTISKFVPHFAAVLALTTVALASGDESRVAPRDYFSLLTEQRPSTMADGSVIISMNVQGDLRGLLTLTLVPEGDGFKGKWTLAASYLEDTRADGSVIEDTADQFQHHHEESPSTPAVHREYVRVAFDGALSGTLDAVSVRRGVDGSVAAIDTAALILDNGTLKLAGADGSGRIGEWPGNPGALTLLLNF